MNRSFGRTPHDPVAVAAAPLLRFSRSPIPPKVLDRSAFNYLPDMLGNNDYPCCVIAGILNAAGAQEALATNGPLAFNKQCWIDIYALCAGIPATLPDIAASNGLNVLDTLRRMARDGFKIGAQTILTGDFGVVPQDRNSLALAMDEMGVIILGVDLAQSDLDAPTGAVWQASPGDPDMGHCLLAFDYTGLGPKDTVRLVTWGGFVLATWDYVHARTQEAYAVLFPVCQPAGVNTVQLAAENARWLQAA